MSQPQICLHDLIDFILRRGYGGVRKEEATVKNTQKTHKMLNISNAGQENTSLATSRCTAEDCLCARSDRRASQKRGLSKTHLSPPSLEPGKRDRRSQLCLNFYSSSKSTGTKGGHGGNTAGIRPVCDSDHEWTEHESHDPVRYINLSCYNSPACWRSPAFVIRRAGWLVRHDRTGIFNFFLKIS